MIVKVEAEGDMTSSELLGRVADAIVGVAKEFGLDDENVELCEPAENKYFSTTNVGYYEFEVCLGSLGVGHLHFEGVHGYGDGHVMLEGFAKVVDV